MILGLAESVIGVDIRIQIGGYNKWLRRCLIFDELHGLLNRFTL